MLVLVLVLALVLVLGNHVRSPLYRSVRVNLKSVQ